MSLEIRDIRVLGLDYRIGAKKGRGGRKGPKPYASLDVDYFDGADESRARADFDIIVLDGDREDGSFRIVLDVQVVAPKGPWVAGCVMGGSFRFTGGLPDEKLRDQFFYINCPAILFPFARETIADMTRRGGFAPLCLPPVNFIALAKARTKAKKPQTEAARPAH